MSWQPNRQSATTLQQQIIQWITAQVERGDWVAGTKLPTQRQLALQFDVNRSTVQQALEELKAIGLLEARVGSGIYVTHNSWHTLIQQTQPNWQTYIETSLHKPNYHTIQLINDYEQRDEMIRLGTGELAPSLLPIKEIEASLQELSFQPKALGYSSPQGNEQLRIAICNYVKKRGIDAEPQHVCIVSGALQALQLIAVGLLEQGSIVFQESTSYLNSIHPFQSVGMQMMSVQRDKQLAQTLTQRKRQAVFYAIPTLHNPTGDVWTAQEKRTLYEACQAARIPIIEDDVYHELLFEAPVPPIKAMDSSGQVLYIGSVSKTLSPGLRIGWLIGPTTVIERLADIKMQTDYGSSAISQEIVLHWLQSGKYDQHLSDLRQQLQQRADFVEQILQEKFQEVASWQTPKGGFYIWLKFHQPIVDKEFFMRLIQRQVLINPGYIYNPQDHHHIRLSYAYASYEELWEGLEILYECAVKSMDFY
ncbi:PLP-dependent aminotransferase family protein [Lysinibacillus macroides]|uniref:GntR family transcriptional regulator n=1 Tax=Lysinibacillus macroides TaxID=33935 RepID=A0A0M9DJ07_9BACI|nr:PLP-dependent aminotransferase family protein [Lysinibacillus macroides]KOY81613.1 GntR family transcriptional regulator [Lysinibacillus macroides]QPR69541.1 PLP-dependent aminotransferase family protein [Lysinibacillus macroides]